MWLATIDRRLLLELLGELLGNQQAFTDLVSAILERIRQDESDLAEDLTDTIIEYSLRVHGDVAAKIHQEVLRQKARLN